MLYNRPMKKNNPLRSQLSEKISAYLYQEINQGHLKEGEKIPSESQLSTMFNVSRNVVREAIARLKSDGLISSRQGAGAFVSPKSVSHSFKINQEDFKNQAKLRQLHELRLDLEVSAAGMAARRRSRSQLESIRQAFIALRQTFEDEGEWLKKDLAFKRAIAEATENEYFKNFILFLTAHIVEVADLERRDKYTEEQRKQLIQEYQAIFDAIQLGDPDLARRSTWQQVINSAQRNGLQGLQGWEITRMSSLGVTYAPTCPPPLPVKKAPSIKLPAGACDSHLHIIGDPTNYPFTVHRSYTPPTVNLEQYTQLQKKLGLSRAVIVQPSVYGYDNRVLLEALKQGGENYRGIVVISHQTSEEELWRMHALGVRGVRINLLYKSGVEVSDVTSLAYRIASLGWHLQLLVDISEFADLYDTLAYLPVDVVIDHMGHMPASTDIEHHGFKDMLRLLKENKIWVKLSGAYRFTTEQTCPYSDVAPFAQQLIATNADRLLWASDWPHVCLRTQMPDDTQLLEEFFSWVNYDAALIRKILVDNPTKLYGF